MTLAELLASKRSGTEHAPAWALADLLSRRNEPLDAKFNPSGVGPGVSYGSLASILADFAPGIGDAKSAADALKEAEAGNYGMSLLDAFGALPMVGGMGAIKAFHGSPHKFDAFDMSKIGTGEGAQAYGHGLYFAESPEVAQAYLTANASGGRPVALFDGQPITEIEKKPRALDWLDSYGDIRTTRAALKGRKDDVLQELDDLVASGRLKEPGEMYETSLEWPDPAREASDPLGPQHFLDWDKPLSEQPEGVRNALAREWLAHPIDHANQSGREIYNATAMGQRDVAIGRGRHHDTTLPAIQAAAATELLSAGIPGIRYLDQGSRGAGDGTYNYVVFDDKIPRIVSRNGVSLRELYGR